MAGGRLSRRSVLVAAACLLAGGCAAHHSDLAVPTTQPGPVRPLEGLKYLSDVLNDPTRQITIFKEREGAELDDFGRRSLRVALPKWWHDVEVVTTPEGEQTLTVQRDTTAPPSPHPAQTKTLALWRSTPDFVISIFPKGSAKADTPSKAAEVKIQIYNVRRFARVMITDENQPRLVGPIFVVNSLEPYTWASRLFSGKL